MPAAPTNIEIRAYQVGFGDCFLLTFRYKAAKARHVLIDFGTTGLPRKGKPSVQLPKIAKDIAAVCGEEGLTAVVATHRHADHVNGFATDGRSGGAGTIIKGLKPKLILQPWTEDPKARRTASSATGTAGKTSLAARTQRYVTTLAAMNDFAARVQELAESAPSTMSATTRRQLGFLGEANIANKSAITNLQAMGKRAGSKARYLRYGDKTGLERLLPGVKVRVLGPPDLRQTQSIRTQTASDPTEFWQLAAGLGPTAPARAGAKSARKPRVPVEARWFRRRLDALQEQSLLQIVRQLDSQMNNTSLILLFEVGGKKLLFPGDAQLENWSYALAESKDAEKNKALLADVDVYKVGHHGSRNATPRQMLWENFAKRKNRKLVTLLSTMPGKHGTAAAKTEVPRRSLLRALEKGSALTTTTKLRQPAIAQRVDIVL